MTLERKSFLAGCAVVLGGLLAAGSAGVLALYLRFKEFANPAPSPEDGFYVVGDKDALWQFPEVDWDYWQYINPSVSAWINIPNTDVNYPVVQANQFEPTFYLTHDVYRNWNPYGCPYLDWQSGISEWGHQSVVFGHNMDDGSMFAPLARYSEPSWADDHPVILLQTPLLKKVLHVGFVQVVDGQKAQKRFEFASSEEYLEWLRSQHDEAIVRLGFYDSPDLYILCTCSNNYYASERTLVFAFAQEDA
ncbi:MAG: class B sortase [Coriobacteriia bacterium]|nr:class B sortase [Coriobacteriia bacterium]